MTETIRYTGTIEATSCGVCGVHFGMPSDMLRKCRERGRGEPFWCPNGHRLSFHESEADRLRNQLAAAKSRQDQLYATLQSARDETTQERNRVRAYRGVITKTKKRVSNGVCPCCSRVFQNLARHMNGMHPDYANPEGDS